MLTPGSSSSLRSALLALCLVGLLLPMAVLAQGLPQGLPPGMTLDELATLRARMTGTTGQPLNAPSPVDAARHAAESSAAGQPAAVSGPAGEPEPSRLEKDYSDRAGVTLQQFGYGLFQGQPLSEGPFTGAIAEDYVLGAGDELVVTFLGQTSQSVTTRVDREGRVVLPDLPPVPAAGRRFADFRADLEASVKAARIGTQVFVSVGALRMIRVVVAGEVVNAGVRRLTGFSTALEALLGAGGVKKSGSLRRIQVRRGGETLVVDLYNLLIRGNLGDQLTLMDGDILMVPTLGPTVAVAGDVKRPGIFELLPGEGAPALAELAEWAGGALRPSGNRFLLVSLDPRGRDLVQERANLKAAFAREGDILLVQQSETKYRGSVFLTGHVRNPGLRSLAAAPTVARLVTDIGVMKESPYLLFAALSRVDSRTGARTLTAVNLTEVLARRADLRLEADDVLIVPSAEDVRYLSSADIQTLLGGQAPSPSRPPLQPTEAQKEGGLVEALADRPTSAPSGCRGRAELAALIASDRAGRFANALRGLVEGGTGAEALRLDCPQIFNEYPELLRYMLEHAVAVQGEVRSPGIYPVRQGTPLASVVAYAGGLTREADQTNIEITRFTVDSREGTSRTFREKVDLKVSAATAVALEPGDVVHMNPVFSDRDTGPVILSGEFVRPGLYNITRGERLSDLIARAGGMTEQAYPYGAVFTRQRVKVAETRNFERYVISLQSAMATAAARARSEATGAAAVAAVEQLIRLLRETPPLGRVVLEADPTVLQVRPEKDTILEAGDNLHVPKRPNYVTLAGEVLNPGAVAFETGATARDYLRLAGGETQASDLDRAFLVLPNGSAQPLSTSAWNFTPTLVPPGSTIVVPRDPLPFDWMIFAGDITGIFRDVAVAAAALAAVSD